MTETIAKVGASKPVEQIDKSAQSGFFNLSSVAKNRVSEKRKRKGLGEIKKREDNAFKQFYGHGLTAIAVNCMVAPIERMRIILQTKHMISVKSGIIMPKGSAQTFSTIVHKEGVGSLWRGNMPNIYHSTIQMFMRVLLFDKIKNYWMPYEAHKYIGFDYFWRIAVASMTCQTLSLVTTYPFELIHTRMCADMTQKGQSRLFTTTFDCFNRTNLDEGRYGLAKGIEIAVASALIRSLLQLPIYEFIKRTSSNDSNTTMGKFNQRIGSAMISGVLMSLILYPLDTSKRCMQLNGARGFLQPYKSSLDCITKLGLKSSYRGVHLYLLTSVLASYAQFQVYDLLTSGK